MTKLFSRKALALVVGLGPAAAWALQAAAPDTLADDGPSMGWVLLRTVVVLGLVVALVYLTLNVGLRKLMGVQSLGARGALVSVLERIPLDSKRTLFVLKAGEEYLLVGAGEGSMSLLSKLNPEEVLRVQASRASGPTLSPFLQRLLSRRGGSPPPTA